MHYPALLKPFPEILRQPTWVAALASVGIHGLFWIVLPVLPLSSKTAESDKQQPVKVVELSPSEQSRLPEFSANAFPSNLNLGANALPPVSLPANSSQTDLFPFLPPPQQPSTQLPPSTSAPLYNFSPITPPPPATSWSFSSPLDLSRSKNLPLQEATPPAPNPNPGLKATPKPEPKAETSPFPTAIPVLPSGPLSLSLESPNPTTTPSIPPEPSASSSANSSESTGRPKKIPQSAIAYQQEKIKEYREKYARNNANTTEPELRANLSSWINSAKEEYKGDSLADQWEKKDEITSLYPQSACPAKLQGTAVIGLVVAPEGQPAGEPRVLLSSGYKLLDETALNYVKTTPLQGNGKNQPTIFPFKFEYSADRCVAGTSGQSNG